MTPLAVAFGRFAGAVLAECAPVLVEIIAHAIQKAFTNTVEDGARRDDLRERLLERLRAPNTHRAGAAGGTGAHPQNPEERSDLGGG